MKGMYNNHIISVYHIPVSTPTCREAIDCTSHLCKTVAGMKDDGSPIEWMLSLPLHHFLKQQSEPYGEAELDVVWERDLALGLRSARKKARNLEK